MYLAVVSVCALFILAFSWSLYVFCIYIGICVVILTLFYFNAYNEGWKYINKVLETDFKNIEISYMTNSGNHMWVADWRGKVVGMVGLLVKESHKPKIAELNRLNVLSAYRGKGVGAKLLERVVNYAKTQRYDRLVLITTSAQKNAYRFYKKHGFQIVDVRPFPQILPTDLRLHFFELEL